MSATLNHYIFNAPEHKIRDLLVVMCNNDPYVQDCTRHWIKSIRQETLLRAQEEHAFAAAAPGYYNNNSINETIIANNTTINGTIITNNNNNINGTSNVSVCNGGLGWNINSSSSIRTTSHNGASVQMQNRNQVTVNGNMMPIPNGPPQPQNMKRKGMEERPAPPGPKRVAMGTGVSERVPERRQVRESVVKREPVPEVKRESMPVVKAEYPETRIAAQRKVRIKTESREPTPPTAVPAPVPSPPHRKVRIKTEPTIITDSVRVCDMCEKRYREIGNTDKSCRHHPGTTSRLFSSRFTCLSLCYRLS